MKGHQDARDKKVLYMSDLININRVINFKNIHTRMPNPADNKAYFIDDLEKYIVPTFQPVIDEDLKHVLLASDDVEEKRSASLFDIGINEETEEEKGKDKA